MNLPLVYFLYFVIGATEWFLAVNRVTAQLQKRKYLVATIVVLEVLLGFFIFDKFFADNHRDWLVAFIYAAGCGIGSASAKPPEDHSETVIAELNSRIEVLEQKLLERESLENQMI